MDILKRRIISQRNKLVKVIKKNNLIELKTYINENHIRSTFINYGDYFDILIWAIENDVSYDIIKFIINQWYPRVDFTKVDVIDMEYGMTDSDENFINDVELNNTENIIDYYETDDESDYYETDDESDYYEIDDESEEENNKKEWAYPFFFCTYRNISLKSPLTVSMEKNNLKVADLLIEHGAWFDYMKIILFEDTNINISQKTLKNVLKRNIPINEETLFLILQNDYIWLLEKVIKNNVYNNSFIIKLLNIYKNKKELSKTQLENILHEGSKFSFDEDFYIEVVGKYFYYNFYIDKYKNDYYLLTLIYDNDIRNKKVKLLDIYKALKEKNTNKIMGFIDYIYYNGLEDTIDEELLYVFEKYIDNNDVKQEIIELIENNDFKSLKAFMENNDIKFTDYEGEYNDLGLDYTDIFKSIFFTEKSYPNKKIIKLLIDYGADINMTSQISFNHTTPLYQVIDKNNIELAMCLVEWGAKVDYPLNCSDNPIYLALKRDKKLFKFMINHINNIDNYLWSDLLEYSLKENDIDLVKCIIEHSTDINKCSCLSIILKSRRKQDFFTLNFTKEIIDKMGDVNKVHKYSENLPLFIAIELKDMEVITYLVEKKGADVNKINKTGDCTPLGVALNLKEINIIQYLIDHGADINKAMYESKFFLNIAIENKDMKMIEYLIECGVDVNLEFPSENRNIYNNESPLNTAIIGNNMNIIKYLIHHGAKINNRSLLFASKMKNLDFINYILGKEVEVNNGALNYAVKFNNLTLVKQLIEAGADVNKKNFYSDYKNYGNEKKLSPLYIALRENKFEIVKFLISHGTILNMNDNNKYTHLVASIQSGNDELVKYLIEWVISHSNEKRKNLFIFTGNAYTINDNYNLNINSRMDSEINKSVKSFLKIEEYLNKFVKNFNIKY